MAPLSDRTALFVIDVQTDLANDPTTEVPDAKEIRTTLSTILARVRETNAKRRGSTATTNIVQLIFVQHNDNDPNDPLAKDKPSWQLVFAPDERAGDWHVSKSERDTFASNESLAKDLHENGIRDLVMCGVQSECCVQSTTLGALQKGFERVTLLSGAHSTYPHEQRSLEKIKKDVEDEVQRQGGMVEPWQEWLARLDVER